MRSLENKLGRLRIITYLLYKFFQKKERDEQILVKITVIGDRKTVESWLVNNSIKNPFRDDNTETISIGHSFS
jgi:hypothetical protein